MQCIRTICLEIENEKLIKLSFPYNYGGICGAVIISTLLLRQRYYNNIMIELLLYQFVHSLTRIFPLLLLLFIFCTYVICFRNQSGAVDAEKEKEEKKEK